MNEQWMMNNEKWIIQTKLRILANAEFCLGCASDLDAKPCVADLDAGRFCWGYTDPLAMMGAALDRYLPGRNAMLANEIYVENYEAYLRIEIKLFDKLLF